MKTIQMTMDESLRAEVDHTIETLNITRSACLRQALPRAQWQQTIQELEGKHAKRWHA